ncbi:sensor histidine kinase [Companilactobacillus jidongensis]|uniref:sensor histidine kinase n=1 Tax=Companilactobacillus jidongensis TaxID=2486006 RepID=UPI0013DE17BC|nr:HAMP domain-containing sensor histidine kinase [Companilactobacillus jidongensis]
MIKKFMNRSNSSAGQITKAYTLILSLIIILIGLSLTVTVGYQLVRSRIEDSHTLMDNLQKSFIDDKPDWNRWRKISDVDETNTYVKVYFYRNGKKHVFYSEGAGKFENESPKPKTLYKSFQYKDGQKFFYHETSYNRGIHYEIWTSFHNVLHIFHLIFDILLFVMIFGLIIGIWLISILAKKLNKPLEDLTAATHEVNQANKLSYNTQLPIPRSPQEVHDLSKEFNQLLTQLNTQAIRDHQFVSDASHELRTPLTAVRGHVQFIERHGTDHPEIIPKSLKFIDSESLRMQDMIESLLQLSRMDHAKVQRDYVELSELINDTLDNYESEIPQKIHRETSNKVVAFVNNENIKQVIIALLNNASKYSDSSSTISVELTSDNNKAEIKIADNGMGIPDNEKSEVFERFYRVDKARSQDIPGTGLGLSIVKKIVELNDGKVFIKNNHPIGSIFVIELPTKKI